jgi:hypothetical protein
MMMAPDPTPPPSPAFSPEALARTGAALSRYVDNPKAPGDLLREALDELATEAHLKAVPPEQLLVVLKDLWYSLPAVRKVDDSAAQARLLQMVVTMCIKEYYRGG